MASNVLLTVETNKAAHETLFPGRLGMPSLENEALHWLDTSYWTL